MLIDPLEYLFTRPPGSAVLAITESGAAIFCREDRSGLAGYPKPCPIALRLHAWTVGRVVVVAFMARLNDSDSGTFETWINAWDLDGLGVAALASLAVQPTVNAHLYITPTRPQRSIQSPNMLKSAAEEVRQAAGAAGKWTMGNFDIARREIESRHPSVAQLWAAGTATTRRSE